MVKNQGQQVFIESRAKLESKKKRAAENQHKKTSSVLTKDSLVNSKKDNVLGNTEKKVVSDELASREQPAYSYQQISCLDSVIRYLESYSIPSTVKRKYESLSNTTSSCSDDDKQKATDDTVPVSEEIAEDGPGGTEQADNQLPPPSTSTAGSVNQEKEPYKELGLTKEVLAVHTQKEEQTFLSKFKELRRFSMFESPCNYCSHERLKGCSGAQGYRPCIHNTEPAFRRSGKNRKSKSKRIKQHVSSDSTMSGTGQPHRPPLMGLNHTAWSPSDTSRTSNSGMPFPAVIPAYPVPVFPAPGPASPVSNPSLPSFNDCRSSQDIHNPVQPAQFPASLVTPMVALMLPNYVFPQMNSTVPPQLYPGQSAFPSQPTFTAPPAFSSQPPLTAQPQFMTQAPFPSHTPYPTESFHYNTPVVSENHQVSDLRGVPSRSSTPQSIGPQDHASPPLFQSRCSSPLQLNLLQLEEMPRSVEWQESGAPVLSFEGPGSAGEGRAVSKTSRPEENQNHESVPLLLSQPRLIKLHGASDNVPFTSCSLYSKDVLRGVGLTRLKSEENFYWNNVSYRGFYSTEVGSPGEAPNSDDQSTSSDLLDILLQEDSRSGTGSAASGSGGSAASGSSGLGSNGYGMSGSGIGSSQTSNTSKYFGSIDSSENDQKANIRKEVEQSDNFMKYVLQDPIWLLMANADEKVMMTYQIPARDLQRILKEDKQKLKRMQKFQPEFTEKQKKELVEVHPWIKKGGLPKAVDVKDCVCSGSNIQDMVSTPYDVEIHDLDLGGMVESSEECSLQRLSLNTEEQRCLKTSTDCEYLTAIS